MAPSDGDQPMPLTDNALLSQVIANLPHGVVVHAPDGSIVAHNESALVILGLTHDQLVGRSSMDPHWQAVRADGGEFPGNEHPAMVTLSTGAPCCEVIMGVGRPDGTRRWIRIDSFPLDFEVGSRGACVTFSDVTGLHAPSATD